MNWMCWFKHDWRQSRKLNLVDGFPPPHLSYENPIRLCARCGKIQYWLPGYGGSEWGCWLPMADG